MSDNHIVACYCRVSTENQTENYSIDEQKERLTAFCKAKGWGKPQMFIDAGFSGGSVERPALNDLLNSVRAGRINLVVVYKLDRLSRSQKDTLFLIEDVFNKYGASFVSVCENFDTGTPFGKAMIGILSVFAQLEKDQITERFTMGRIGRAKNGLFHGGGNAPAGYDYIDGHLVINEYEAVMVREIFDRFLSGDSIRAVAKFIDEKYGGGSHTKVYNILKNSVYIGKVKFKGVEYNGEHIPLISYEKFFEVQRLLSRRSAESSGKTPFRAGFLLSGLIRCGGCGAKYHGNHGYYKCYSRTKSDKRYINDPNCKNPHIKISELDELVCSEIALAEFDISVLPKENETHTFEQVFEQRLSEIKEQQNRLIDLYQTAAIPLESVSEKLRALENERIRVEKQILKSQKKDNGFRGNDPNTSERRKKLLKTADTSAARMFLSLTIERITVMQNGDIEIKWKI